MRELYDRENIYKTALDKHIKGYCNCSGFLMTLPESKSRILYEQTENGILFARDDGGCYSLFAVGDFKNGIDIGALDKPVIFTNSGPHMPPLIGFSKLRTSVRMLLTPPVDLPQPKYCVRSARECDTHKILSLLTNSLPNVDIPPRDELLDLVKKGYVYIIKDAEDIIATATAQPEGKRYIISHVASKQSERGMGYAKSVLCYAIGRATSNGAKGFALWVDTENLPAVNLYEKLGFKRNKSEREQWILS